VSSRRSSHDRPTGEATPVVKPPALSPKAKLMLAVLREPNEEPGEPGTFVMYNVGSEPTVGTLYIDANPGELSKPVRFLYEQKGPAVLLRGEPPEATYEAYFEAFSVPVARPFLDIVAKMNEGQFLKLGPNDKGVCIVPASRRAAVLSFLGFRLA
jgi:hypothetical protein